MKDSISPSSNSDQDLVSLHDIHVHVLEKRMRCTCSTVLFNNILITAKILFFDTPSLIIAKLIICIVFLYNSINSIFK